MKLTAITSAVLLFGKIASADGFEPMRIEPDGSFQVETTRQIDHLEPLPLFHRPPEFHYLAQYWAEISDSNYHYVAVYRDPSTREYIIQEGKRPKGEIHGPPSAHHRVAISEETATVIYEYWVNMLFQTRYSREQRPFVLGGTLYSFSTFVSGIGYMHGYTATGVSEGMPPYWLSQSGEALYSFVTATNRDEQDLRRKLSENRDMFYKFIEAIKR